MSQEYLKLKAREALTATSGNRREAGLLLRVWTENDPELKKALVAPFLPNLCALAIQRAVASSEGRSARRSKPRDDAASLLSAIGSSQTQSMSSTRQDQSPPPRSSARHRQAVATLAAAFKKKN